MHAFDKSPTSRASTLSSRMESIAQDFLYGNRDWDDIVTNSKQDMDLVKRLIWVISFCSWFPIINMFMSMAEYEGLKESFSTNDKDDDECDNLTVTNSLLTYPIYVYGLDIFTQYIFVQRNSKLNFRRKVNIYLIILYTCSISKTIERGVLRVIFSNGDNEN